MAVDLDDDDGVTSTPTVAAKAPKVSTAPATDYKSFPAVDKPAVPDYAASVAATANAAAVTTSGGASSTVENTNTDWINKKWRPMMGWSYMATCLFDFIAAPILWSIAQALSHGGTVATQWQPLTLQGAGLYHVAMGAVLGIAAFGRTKEKMESKA